MIIRDRILRELKRLDELAQTLRDVMAEIERLKREDYTEIERAAVLVKWRRADAELRRLTSWPRRLAIAALAHGLKPIQRVCRWMQVARTHDRHADKVSNRKTKGVKDV